jgi:DNA-binding NarL/FixJ family response regulator
MSNSQKRPKLLQSRPSMGNAVALWRELEELEFAQPGLTGNRSLLATQAPILSTKELFETGESTTSCRIMIVEDHLMFAEVLRKICEQELGYQVVGEATDGHKAVSCVETARPDVVLLDLHLPNLDGFVVAESLRKLVPTVRILILSSHCDEYTVARAERVKVNGFVDKNTNTVASLKTAITAVAGGQEWFSAAFQRVRTARAGSQAVETPLTPKERTIIKLITESKTDTEVARALSVPIETVARHRYHLLRKLSCGSNAA